MDNHLIREVQSMIDSLIERNHTPEFAAMVVLIAQVRRLGDQLLDLRLHLERE